MGRLLSNSGNRGSQMKHTILAMTAAAALAIPAAAQAADLAVKAPIYKAPPPVEIFTWTGCYIGGNVGGKWARTDGSVNIPAATGAGGASPASTLLLARDSADT